MAVFYSGMDGYTFRSIFKAPQEPNDGWVTIIQNVILNIHDLYAIGT